MATFEITMITATDVATVYVDDISEFIAAMDVRVVRTSRRIIGLPVLAGYRGPLTTGRFENGEPVLRYEDSSTPAVQVGQAIPQTCHQNA